MGLLTGGTEPMRLRILGIVKEKESGEPVSGLLVYAYDKDVLGSDFLGKAETGSDGRFTIEYDSGDFQDALDKNPDLYIEVHRSEETVASGRKKGKPIYSTKKDIRHNASSSEKFYIEIPKKKLG